MFKRANKITALLVAAASIMSVVPAMADTTTTTSSRLESKDGTIENAVAYSGGKYAYQGYKSSDDTDAVYYNGGNTTDKALDDLSSADLNESYADKYAFANDGSSQYLVDLTSGEVTDSTTPVDDADTAATKLQTKLKKTDRYGESLGVSGTLTADTNLEGSGSTGDTIADNATVTLPGNKFGDIWYSYAVPTPSTDATKYLTDGKLFGFTDSTGKYLDASYLANIYAYSTKEGKTVKIDNYSNSYDDKDSDSGLIATLTKQPVVLTQDKDYLYTLVTVAITDTYEGAVTPAGAITTTAAVSNAGTNSVATTLRTYVQKVSKAQGEQQDGAYLPKTVESYEVGNVNSSGTSNTEYDCSDASDAYNAILTAIKDTDNGASVSNLAEVEQKDVLGTTSSNGVVRPVFTISNGNLVAIEAGSDKLDAVTLNFKKDKVKFKAASYPARKDATSTESATYFADNKVDVYLVEKDSDDSVDLNTNSSNNIAVQSYDVDVDGNVWVVADGKIYEYKNATMTKVYTCDSALDSISVYDANSLITWENSGNVYTTINEGTAATTDATTTAAVTTKTGWDQLADGTWNFYDATGAKVVSNWVNAGGVWYYLKADGVMATGWLNDNGTWYYLASSGAMKTGWLNDNGTWYYLNASGAMAANTTVDGYTLNASGAWVN